MGFKIFFHIILRTYQENISGIMLLLLRLLKIRLRRGFLINKYFISKILYLCNAPANLFYAKVSHYDTD